MQQNVDATKLLIIDLLGHVKMVDDITELIKITSTVPIKVIKVLKLSLR